MRPVFLFLIFLFSIRSPIFAEKKYFLEFVYVNANEGQSSGGHSAFKLGSLVYHFQYFPDKIFHIVREPWAQFRYVYGILENRTIKINRIRISEKDYKLLLEKFNEFYMIQAAQLDRLTDLANDKTLLDSFFTNEKIRLKGYGYFSKERGSPDLIRLRTVLETGKNGLSLSKESLSVLLKMKTFSFSKLNQKIEPPNPEIYPVVNYSISGEYLNLLYRYLSLDIIRNDFHLKKGSFIDSEILLNEKEIQKLESYRKDLENQIRELILKEGSGYSLLIAAARYCIIGRSLERGKFSYLSLFHSGSVLYEIQASAKKHLEMLLTVRKNQLEEKRLEFAEQEFSEKSYSKMETEFNFYHEIEEGLNRNIPIRLSYASPVPSREELAEPILPENLKQEFTVLSLKREQEYREGMQKLYPFHLITTNCTTELFYSINRFLDKSGKNPDAFLGGRIEPDETFVFIPFYAYYKTAKVYNTADSVMLSSLRTQLLSKNQDFSAYLRETNTITSAYYKFNSDDSFFIFFTDDVLFVRPLYGIVNISAGVGQAITGAFISPFDRGNQFVKGVRGILFSGTEIFFFNVRKGSFTESAGDAEIDFLYEGEGE